MPRGSNILPSNRQMLHAIRSTLSTMRNDEVLSSVAVARLGVIDQLLNELILRIDVAPYRALYGRLLELIGRGLGSESIAAGLQAGSGAVESDPLLPADISLELSPEAYGAHLNQAFRQLTRLTEAAICQGPQGLEFVDEAVKLERELYELRRRHAPGVPALTDAKGIQLTTERLEAYLARRWPEKGFAVTDLKIVPGGYQKTTAIFQTRDSNGREDTFVIRADKPDKFVHFDASWVAKEFAIVSIAHALGIPTAEPKWLETDADALGAPFMVTSKVPGSAMAVTGVAAGESPASILGPRGVRSIFETLAYIHSRPVADLADTCIGHWLECRTLSENTAKAVKLWKAEPYWWPAEASPTLSGAMAWLGDNIPQEDGPVSLLHVDFGTHNLMIDRGRVAAVLDWESARIGDPAEDVMFVLFSLGPDVDREQALGWYRDAGGPPLSPERLRYFDVYNRMKFAISGPYSAGLLEQDGGAAIEWNALALHITGASAAALMDAISQV